MSKLPKKAATQIEPMLVDVKALARILSTSVRSVWRLNSGGKLPRSVRVGRSVRWDVEALHKWIEVGCPDRATFETGLGAKKRGEVEDG